MGLWRAGYGIRRILNTLPTQCLSSIYSRGYLTLPDEGFSGSMTIKQLYFPNFFIYCKHCQGCNQDFSKGRSHSVKQRILTRLSCRPPRSTPGPPPPPSYGLDYAFVLMLVVRSLCYFKISPSMTSSIYFFLDNKLMVQGFF